jgi:hypothetical protein
VYGVVGGDVGLPVALEVGGRLGQGLVEVGTHHLAQRVDRTRRVGVGKELGDLIGVRIPGVPRRLHGGVVAGLRRGE